MKKWPTWYYGVGAGGLALVYFLFKRNQAKKAAPTAAATAAGTATAPVVAAGNPSPNDFSAVLDQLAALQGTASTASSSTVVPSTTNPLTDFTTQIFHPGSVTSTGQTVVGGFAPASGQGSLTANGHTYQFISDFNQATAARKAGQQFFIETAPGVFGPEPKGQYAGAGWLQVS